MNKGICSVTASRVGLVLSLIANLAMLFLPSANWGQVHPQLGPDIPSYLPADQVSGRLVLSPSETMRPLVRAWVEELVRRHPKLNMTMAREGTETGLTALLEHRSDIAAMPRRLTASELAEFVREYGYEPTEVPIAADALAIYVHKDNPLTGLSLDELDAMFCRERRRGLKYDVDSWGLVGVMDEWFEAPVQLYARTDKTGHSNFFCEEVCNGGTLHPQLFEEQGLASVVLDVGADPNGIGFSAIGYGTAMVKPVPIAKVKNGRYVEPSMQAAMDASYPLRRNIYFYIAKPPKATATAATIALVRYVLSRQGQQQAIDAGYLPLTSTEIVRLAEKWSISAQAARLETP